MLCHGAGGTRRAVAPGGAGIIGLPGSNRSAVQVSGGTLELPCLDSPVASLANGASGLFDGEADRGRYARIRDGRASSGPDSSAGADLTARANDGHLPARPWQRGGGGLAGLASGARERARIARWGCQGGAGRLTAGPSRGETGTVGRAANGQQERAEQAGIAESGIYSTPCLALARLALEGPAHGLGIGAGFGNDLGEDGRGDGLLRGGLHTTTVAPLSPTRKYNLSSCTAAPGGHTRPEGPSILPAMLAPLLESSVALTLLFVEVTPPANLDVVDAPPHGVELNPRLLCAFPFVQRCTIDDLHSWNHSDALQVLDPSPLSASALRDVVGQSCRRVEGASDVPNGVVTRINENVDRDLSTHGHQRDRGFPIVAEHAERFVRRFNGAWRGHLPRRTYCPLSSGHGEPVRVYAATFPCKPMGLLGRVFRLAQTPYQFSAFRCFIARGLFSSCTGLQPVPKSTRRLRHSASLSARRQKCKSGVRLSGETRSTCELT